MSTEQTEIDLQHLRGWIGRSEECADIVTPRLIDSLRATLDSGRHFPGRAKAVPVMLHWCLAPAIVPISALGPDAHPARGGFLPPVPLPRRMWAAGTIELLAPLEAADAIMRRSEVTAVDLKEGRTGPLVFVRVRHSYATGRGVAVTEEQTLVYRAADAPAAAAAPSDEAGEHRLALRADAPQLFRYSALTFNGHRIHYDRSYATGEERYPGLVVHGPLQATLLAEFAAELRGGLPPRTFSFRGLSPLFDGEDFALNATTTDAGLALWVSKGDGIVTMRAEAGW